MAMRASTSSCVRQTVLMRKIIWMLKLGVKVMNLFCLVIHQDCEVGLLVLVLM